MAESVKLVVKNNSNIDLELKEKAIVLGDFESMPPAEIQEQGEWLCKKNKFSGFESKGYAIYSNETEKIKIKVCWQHSFGIAISHYNVDILAGKHKIDYAINGQLNSDIASIEFSLYSKNTIDAANWMSFVPDEKTINSLVMPGSHNAGVSDLKHCHVLVKAKKGFIRNQDLNVFNQLFIGTRYFDIRIDFDHNELVTYHRTNKLGCNGQDLESILYECIDFLNAHKKEVLILTFSHIRHDRGEQENIKKKIAEFVSKKDFEPFIYKSENAKINLAELPLQACRGKMILLFDYAAYVDNRKGLFRYRDLSENPKENDSIVYNGHLTIFDKYTNTPDFDKMQQDQLSKLNKYGGLGKKYLFLFSWTLTPSINAGSIIKGVSIKKLANVANKQLAGALEKQYTEFKTLPNIVYLDFLNKELTAEIIKYNFVD